MTNFPNSDKPQSIQAYFSHSYRAEDRDVNRFFWRLFSEQGFFFTVDPKSERTFIPYLERMMRYSDCFIAIVTRRLEQVHSIGGVVLPQPQVVWTHSPYIQFENRLAVRAHKPRLVFVENGLNAGLFGSSEQVQVFERDILKKNEESFRKRVKDFAKLARDYKSYADRIIQPTRTAGIMLDLESRSDIYTPDIIASIRATLQAGGYTTVQISPHIDDDQYFIEKLRDVELLISEIHDPFVTSMALTFTHAMFIPTIRICWHKPDETISDTHLPPLLNGYKVGDADPIVVWSDRDELIIELVRHMQKFQQTRTLLDTLEKGNRYFLSAGRREAKVFISNAHTLNDLALELVRGFQSVNIQFFHYQAKMKIGSAWQEELERELRESDIFIALISDEYHTSRWCQYELEYAFLRWKDKKVVLLPYLITNTKLPELIKDHVQCAFMYGRDTQEIVKSIVETVDEHLTEKEQIPARIRDRVIDFARALERTAIVPTTDFAHVAEETISAMTRVVDIELDPDSLALINTMCRINVNVECIFDLPSFPKILPVLFSQSTLINSSDIEAIRRLVTKEPKRIAILILPDNGMVKVQKALDTGIRKTHACDVVVLTHNQLKSIVRSSDPNEALKRALLAQVNILNYSPFVKTGPAPNRIFFGREAELREITEHALTTSYALIGGRRVGKTSILSRIHNVNLPGNGFRTLSYDCSITATCQELLSAPPKNWQPESPPSIPETIGDLLQSVPTDKPFVLLLDETDKIVPSDQKSGWHFFNTLRALANSGQAQIILTGERTLRGALRDSRSPLFNFPNELPIGCLSYQAVEELITQPMRDLEIELPAKTATIHRIFEFTSGHPNVVQRLGSRLVERLNELDTRRITLEDVNTVIEDPGFQRDDFLSTYWEAATPLEKIISLLMADEARVRTLTNTQRLLEKRCGLHPSAGEIDDAFQRLVDLRSILKRTPTGYEFAVKAFPRVVAGTMTLNDMLMILTEEYEEQGE